MANPYGGARAYQAQSVLTASPGQLVLMLYDGALRYIGQAQEAFGSGSDNSKRIEQINSSLVKAQNILVELQATLNLDAGGDYARNLDRLYDYYIRRLFEANVKKVVDPLTKWSGCFASSATVGQRCFVKRKQHVSSGLEALPEFPCSCLFERSTPSTGFSNHSRPWPARSLPCWPWMRGATMQPCRNAPESSSNASRS